MRNVDPREVATWANNRAHSISLVRRGTVGALHPPTYIPAGRSRRVEEEDIDMTMPSDAADAIRSEGSNEGPRDHEGVDTDNAAYVDDDNVPHPGDNNEVS